MTTALLDQDLASLALLAVVQGLTEFLPVSSTGHLVLAQAALGWEEPALALDVALHLGTLVAVLLVYRTEAVGVVRELFAGRPRELLQLVVGSIPAAVVGIGLGDEIEGAFHGPRVAGLGLLVTAVVLLVGEWARRRNRRRAGEPAAALETADTAPLGWGIVLAIGLAQAVAIWPGVSRSGSTIAIGLLCGLRSYSAARFSFLLSIPAIAGASMLHLPRAFGEEVGAGSASLVLAMLLAAAVGWVALRLLLSSLGRGAFAWFAVYCAVLGALALVR